MMGQIFQDVLENHWNHVGGSWNECCLGAKKLFLCLQIWRARIEQAERRVAAKQNGTRDVLCITVFIAAGMKHLNICLWFWNATFDGCINKDAPIYIHKTTIFRNDRVICVVLRSHVFLTAPYVAPYGVQGFLNGCRTATGPVSGSAVFTPATTDGRCWFSLMDPYAAGSASSVVLTRAASVSLHVTVMSCRRSRQITADNI